MIGAYLLDPSKASSPESPNLRFMHCDLRDRQRVTQVITEYQPTQIFHFGAQSLPTLSWADPVTTFESNIMGSLYLFEAVRHLKRPPVVVSACSSAEYGNVPASAIPVKEEQPLRPLHPYGISKVCLDLLAREYFLDYKIPAVNVGCSTPRARARRTMRPRISCGSWFASRRACSPRSSKSET